MIALPSFSDIVKCFGEKSAPKQLPNKLWCFVRLLQNCVCELQVREYAGAEAAGEGVVEQLCPNFRGRRGIGRKPQCTDHRLLDQSATITLQERRGFSAPRRAGQYTHKRCHVCVKGDRNRSLY